MAQGFLLRTFQECPVNSHTMYGFEKSGLR